MTSPAFPASFSNALLREAIRSNSVSFPSQTPCFAAISWNPALADRPTLLCQWLERRTHLHAASPEQAHGPQYPEPMAPSRRSCGICPGDSAGELAGELAEESAPRIQQRHGIVPQPLDHHGRRFRHSQFRSLTGPHLHALGVSRFPRRLPHPRSKPSLHRIRRRRRTHRRSTNVSSRDAAARPPAECTRDHRFVGPACGQAFRHRPDAS